EQIPPGAGRGQARAALELPADATVVAILPGSREGEVRRLGEDFARAGIELARMHEVPLQFIAPLASEKVGRLFEAQVRAAGAPIRLVRGRADEVLAAADVALVASGTATLQALLHGTPMVVAYRLAPLTAFIARDLGLVKVRHFSLPYLLVGEELVPEYFQQDVRPGVLARALKAMLDDGAGRLYLAQRFLSVHHTLRQGGAGRAAALLVELLSSRRGGRTQG